MVVKHIVIGGGTGFIGSQLVHKLNLEGIKCTCISRMPGPTRMSWYDLEQCGLPNDVDAVINIAGQNILDPKYRWSAGLKQNIWNSRIKTTETLAKAIAQTNAKTFITISGVAYYKPGPNEYTEDSKCGTYDYLSELCHAWENAAQLPKNCNIRRTVIRSGVVLGRNGGMIKQIYKPFFFGLGGPISHGKQYMPWIHIQDLVNMFYYALIKDHVHGIMNGVAPQIITNNEFTKAFAKAMRRPAIIPVPEIALNVIFNKERSKIMLEGQKVIPKRVKELGFEYCYPEILGACKNIVR